MACQFCSTNIIVPEELRRSAPASAAQPANSGIYTPTGAVLTGPALHTAVADWLMAQATQQTGVKLTGQPMVYDRIINATRNALYELAAQESAAISLPFLTADQNGPKHLQTTLTRQMVDELAQGKSNTVGKTPEKKKGLFGF
jgi:hypothetical protein